MNAEERRRQEEDRGGTGVLAGGRPSGTNEACSLLQLGRPLWQLPGKSLRHADKVNKMPRSGQKNQTNANGAMKIKRC